MESDKHGYKDVVVIARNLQDTSLKKQAESTVHLQTSEVVATQLSEKMFSSTA